MTPSSTFLQWCSHLNQKTSKLRHSTVKSPEWVYLTLLRKIEEEHNFLHQWKDKDGMKTRSYKQPPKRKQKKSFDNLEKLVNSIRASEHDAYQKFLDALPGVSLGLLLLSGEVPENLKQCPGDGVEQPQLLRICSHLINSLGKKKPWPVHRGLDPKDCGRQCRRATTASMVGFQMAVRICQTQTPRAG
jgi:hypothetical protein